jgi:pyridoxamine 5'-phosphate oxidase
MNDLASLRREYAEGGLTETEAPAEPMTLFLSWLEDAIASRLHEPNAVVVSTVSTSGGPASRLVLLKGVDEGFVFYTNYDSRKATEIAHNDRVALLFPWHPVGRQVRVEGTAAKIEAAESDTYFAGRPHGSQLGAWASPQSSVVADRAELEQRYAEVERRFGNDVPRPPHWGGYRVVPDLVEFWQGRPDRMHDRLVYRRSTSADWRRERLAP